MELTTVALVPGAPGSLAHMKAPGMPDIDVVIAGEPFWAPK